MSTVDIIRAWKDKNYRESLSEVERALLPDHPAGAIELPENVLVSIVGEAGAGWTKYGETCTVSGDQYSCGWVCTKTTECGCSHLYACPIVGNGVTLG